MLNPIDGFLVYTDGSCDYKDGIGAWAWVAVDGFDEEELHGSAEYDTTVNRMELTAALKACSYLLNLHGPSVILVNSDSEYVVKGITDRTRKRNKNVDLWLELDAVVDSHELVAFQHVKGHAGHHYNEMVDQFAGELRLGAKALDRSSS